MDKIEISAPPENLTNIKIKVFFRFARKEYKLREPKRSTFRLKHCAVIIYKTPCFKKNKNKNS
jgi:hypothetical protein